VSLAYLFWHWPADGVDRADYEQRLSDFHAALALDGSRSFRLARAPYDDQAPGRPYEDWYPVADWRGLGVLNDRAVTGRRKPPHDAAATRAGHGAGGVYKLLQGDPAAPVACAAWLAKPEGTSYESFIGELTATVPDATVWQRQMVLGPAPEFAVLATGPITLPWPAVMTGPQPI
jgi:hypothetical protein